MSVDIDRLLLARTEEGRLRSRKNRVNVVALDGTKYVVKAYEGRDAEERAEREAGILRSCAASGVLVPELLATREHVIVLSYLQGESAMSLLDGIWAEYADDDRQRDSASSQILLGIAGWLSRFHDAFGHATARGDSILKNFMVTDCGIAGLDFEESSASDPMDDLGQLCASLLSSRPMFTPWKLALTRSVRDEYSRLSGIDVSHALPDKIARALVHYGRFRSDGLELITWAERFERHGL